MYSLAISHVMCKILFVIASCASALHISRPHGKRKHHVPTSQQSGVGPQPAEQANVLLLYTTSGDDRHYDALCLQAKLNSRPGTPSILRDADIMVYDNGGAEGLEKDGLQDLDQLRRARQSVDSISEHFPKRRAEKPFQRYSRARKCILQFEGAGKQLYMTSKNAGYKMGAVQAMDAVLHLGVIQKYKWVVHLHPDIFIIFPHPLAESLASSSKSVVAGSWGPCLTFNFFAFKPRDIDVDAFSGWMDYKRVPECYLSFVAFNKTGIDRVPHLSIKHDTNSSWDEYGMWHQHDLRWIDRFLERHPKVSIDSLETESTPRSSAPRRAT